MKPTKRNPQDATLRNIRALKRRVADLTQRVEMLEHAMRALAPLVARPVARAMNAHRRVR
jgi:hypothetical protein